jgi:hypothetical protein
MKFNPDHHIIGKVYDLTQENMQAMLMEIDRLRYNLGAVIKARDSVFNDNTNLQEKLAVAVEALEGWLSSTPTNKDGKYCEINQWHAARALEALSKIQGKE